MRDIYIYIISNFGKEKSDDTRKTWNFLRKEIKVLHDKKKMELKF